MTATNTSLATAGMLFQMPSAMPSDAQLAQLSRSIPSGDCVFIETPDQLIKVGAACVDCEAKRDSVWTVSGSILLTARAQHPRRLVKDVGALFRLKPTITSGDVSLSRVGQFIEDVARSPRSYTRGAIDAQLKAWGRRGLDQLRQFDMMDRRYSEYAEYLVCRAELVTLKMRDAVEHRERENVVDHRFLRNSMKRVDEFAAVGISGWPLRGMQPMRASFVVRSGLELLADWRKEDFAERIMQGVVDGGVRLGAGKWPAVVRSSPKRLAGIIGYGREFAGMNDIHYGATVLLQTGGDGWLQTRELVPIYRAARLLAGADIFHKERSAGPRWWRLRTDPLGKRGMQQTMVDLRYIALNNPGAAIRLFSDLRWLGMTSDISAALVFGKMLLKPNRVWGVAVDAPYQDIADDVLSRVDRVLAKHGIPRKGPDMRPEAHTPSPEAMVAESRGHWETI